ncbi:sugar phosphate isomerase/epimerase [soil metagenome]
MTKTLNRREWLAWTPSAFAAGLAITSMPRCSMASERRSENNSPFGFCLNTSTIRDQGEPLTVDRQVAIAGAAGYQGIEPWIRDLDRYVEQGGLLKDLRRRIEDAALSVESAIGFFPWAVDDDAERAKGLEEARRNLDMLRQLGGKRIAAPPSGATDRSDLDLLRLAERYRALLELGEEFGVVPQVEVWGFSKTLSRLGEAAYVAIESGHPNACVLPDVYHIYKGGSDFQGLALLSGSAMQVFHLNDYPDDPPRSEIRDADRVYPGDGVAPLAQILQILEDNGFRGMLSLELFNPEYWKQDPLEVARTGLEKMKATVQAADRG